MVRLMLTFVLCGQVSCEGSDQEGTQPPDGAMVEAALRYFDGERYQLAAWVVMPNHVHVLLESLPGWPLGKLVQSWKRHTTREIHKLGLCVGANPGIAELHSADPQQGGRVDDSAFAGGSADCKSAIPGTQQSSGALWQREYWDRFIRNGRHFVTAKRYIEDNPVMAGLVETAQAWPWGNARLNLHEPLGGVAGRRKP